MDNAAVAACLLEQARRLDTRRDNLYRVRAYRQAASVVQLLDRPLADLLDEAGPAALERLPGVGKHLAWSIATLIRTGEWRSYAERPRRTRAG